MKKALVLLSAIFMALMAALQPVVTASQDWDAKVYLPIVSQPCRQHGVVGVETYDYEGERWQMMAEGNPSYVKVSSVFWWNRETDSDYSVLNASTTALANKTVGQDDRCPFSFIAGVRNVPQWVIDEGGAQNICGPIFESHFGVFQDYVRTIVASYGKNVAYWEFGNEPDAYVGKILPDDQKYYGCWGDPTDQYYGGQLYGQALFAFAQAVWDVDPTAEVMSGGLMLPCTACEQANFLKGMVIGFLEKCNQYMAGAACTETLMKVTVAYHAYFYYNGSPLDPAAPLGDWQHGPIIGKAAFIDAVFADAGLPAPKKFVNEGGYLCNSLYPPCLEGIHVEQQAQAIVQIAELSESLGIPFVWYALSDTGWGMNEGLLTLEGEPRPVYFAWRNVNQLPQTGD